MKRRSIGPSGLVPYKPNESTKERHDRRLRFNREYKSYLELILFTWIEESKDGRSWRFSFEGVTWTWNLWTGTLVRN